MPGVSETVCVKRQIKVSRHLACFAARTRSQTRPGPFDVAIPRRFIEISEQAVGAKRWHRSWQAGHAMSVVAAVAYGLA